MQAIYFLWEEEKATFFAMSERGRHLYLISALATIVDWEKHAAIRRLQYEAQEAARWEEERPEREAREAYLREWEEKYGGLTAEERAFKQGQEIRDKIAAEREQERTADSFVFPYLVGMSDPGTQKRLAADQYIATIADHVPPTEAPDTLEVNITFYNDDPTVPFPAKNIFGEIQTDEDREEEQERAKKIPGWRGTSRHELPPIKVCLFVIPGGLAFETSGGRWVTIGVRDLYPELIEGINSRNARRGWTLPAEVLERFSPTSSSSSSAQAVLPPPLKPDGIAVYTSQEADALMRSAADGRSGRNWRNEELQGVRVWEVKDASHRVEIERGESVDDQPIPFSQIEQLTEGQSIDFASVLFYVLGCLCPPPGSPETEIISGVIDLNDMMANMGWFAGNPGKSKREELRTQAWRMLVFGEEAIVKGSRNIVYRDKYTGSEIPTFIESPVWRTMRKQRPKSNPLAAPLRVEIVIGREWLPMFSDPHLAQYMPMGELIGEIPGGQPSGDWARVIGYSLARLWRMNPRKALTGELEITRRDVLTHYTPKTKTVEQILASNDPRRAVEYYKDALNFVLDKEIIADEGDASKEMSVAEMLKPYGRQGWGTQWLNDKLILRVGKKWRPPLEVLAKNTYVPKPRDLKTLSSPSQKRRK